MDAHHSHHASEHDEQAAPGQGELYGVLAEYQSPGELVHAANQVREAGYTQFDCFSPFPVHGIDDAIGIKRTILPALVFCGGIAGLVVGLFLQWYLNSYNWPWNISGKPIWSLPANIPIGFETTILLSVFTTFFGMWILNRLPQVWHPFFRLDRFARVSDDSFMLGIEAKDSKFDLAATTRLLKAAGALEVEACHIDPRPSSRRMPKWIFGLIVASGVMALIPLALVAKWRASTSKDPHVHIFADMDFQPKAKSDQVFDLFADGRANRGAAAGTVARGQLNEDDEFYRGLTAGAAGQEWLTGFPASLPVTPELMARGQERFNIYCTPCHGHDGRGEGAVPKRLAESGALWQARNLVDPAAGVVRMRNGQLFNTISNGFGTMAGYASQIPHQDRWAIVLYVRALERAQNATSGDAAGSK
jgi:mono/diheme cytochrome c family protein